MKQSNLPDQQGFVSIIVAMFIMLFVSLLALGFAFLARQNQSQGQNRILSTQAFYAAESAVNDAIDYLAKNPGAPTKPDCSGNIPGLTGAIGSNNPDINYTCVTYNVSPPTLEYPITNDSRVVKVQAAGGAVIRGITISWQDSQNSNPATATFANGFQGALHGLPQAGYTPAGGNDLSSSIGIIRATVIPAYGNGTSLNRSDLTNKTQTLFLYPRQGPTGNTVNFTTSTSVDDPNQGVYVDGNCSTTNTPQFCSVKINGLDSQGGTDTIYLRLRTLYRPSSSVTISATTNTGAATNLVNAQAVIDATGKADDVLRRIQVRVPLAPVSVRPEFAIETIDGICKRVEVWSGGSQIDNPGSILSPNFGLPSVCKPDTP